MRNNLAPSKIIPLLLVLLCAAPGAYAQASADEDEATQEESSTMQNVDDEKAVPPAATSSAQAQKTAPAASSSDIDLLNRITFIDEAIAKFKTMGVGVTPFEQGSKQARELIADNKLADADTLLQCLKRGLEDQQRRFYANKMQVWHNQIRPHTKDGKKRAAKLAYRQVAHRTVGTPANAGAGLAQGAHGVLAKSDAKYTPTIYPIAR